MEESNVRIKKFISTHFRNHDLQEDEDIFAAGFVNSLFAIQLVAFLEKEFDITIEDEDLDLENFKTINAMVALIERKNASPTYA